MCGEQVDGVPPGDSGEQVPHHGQESGRAVRHIPAQVVDGEVVVLALGQPPAAQRDRGAVRLVRAGHSCQHGAGQGAANGRGHAQERRHVLHVRPESDGPLGVGRGGVFEGDPLQYRVGEGAVRRVRNRPGCDAHETHHTAITHICRLVSPDARCHHPLWGHRHGLSPDRRRRTRRRRRRTGRADRLRRACDESAAVAVVPALLLVALLVSAATTVVLFQPQQLLTNGWPPQLGAPRRPSRTRWRTGCARSPSCRARCSTWRPARCSARSWGWPPRWRGRCSAPGSPSVSAGSSARRRCARCCGASG